jgi:hypothetical protein
MNVPGYRRSLPSRGIERPYYDIQGPTIHGALRCVLLGEQLLDGEAHFIQELSRHYPCPGDGCIYCEQGRGKRRKAYVAAMTTASQQNFVLELTDHAINQLHELTPGRLSLRGLIVTLSRAKNKKGTASRQGKVLVVISGEVDEAKLPPAFDEVPHLQKMWGQLAARN